MSTSTSKSAYADCFDLFDRALAAPRGIRNRCEDDGVAYQLRGRLHTARKLSRLEAFEIYEADDPLYGQSPYDHLVVKIKEAEGGWWVYIEPRRVVGEVQELAAE
jgi:hypothetical protein